MLGVNHVVALKVKLEGEVPGIVLQGHAVLDGGELVGAHADRRPPRFCTFAGPQTQPGSRGGRVAPP